MTSQTDRTAGRPEGRAQATTVITAAELPYDEQVRNRRRKYLLMMGLRIPLLIAAVACYHIPWLAILLLCVMVPLPWMAVLIANDRPARQARKVLPGTINHERALPAAPREIVESD